MQILQDKSTNCRIAKQIEPVYLRKAPLSGDSHIDLCVKLKEVTIFLKWCPQIVWRVWGTESWVRGNCKFREG